MPSAPSGSPLSTIPIDLSTNFQNYSFELKLPDNSYLQVDKSNNLSHVSVNNVNQLTSYFTTPNKVGSGYVFQAVVQGVADGWISQQPSTSTPIVITNRIDFTQNLTYLPLVPVQRSDGKVVLQSALLGNNYLGYNPTQNALFLATSNTDPNILFLEIYSPSLGASVSAVGSAFSSLSGGQIAGIVIGIVVFIIVIFGITSWAISGLRGERRTAAAAPPAGGGTPTITPGQASTSQLATSPFGTKYTTYDPFFKASYQGNWSID